MKAQTPYITLLRAMKEFKPKSRIKRFIMKFFRRK